MTDDELQTGEKHALKPRYLSLRPLIPWQQVERPIDWRQRFGRQAPLEVEIGFGNGDFMAQRAQAHPERNLVGIELKWASVQRGLRKMAQAGVDNARLIQADARVALERLFVPQSVHGACALFPCPWPKERHAKHRLFDRAFLRLLNSRLTAGGEVQIVTDHRPYLDWMLEQLPETGFAAAWEAIPPQFGTKYEQKWHSQGQKRFYALRLRKQTHWPIPLKEDVALKSHRVARFDPDRFQPSGARGEATVDFKEFLFDPRRQKGLIRTFIVEGSLKQEVWIEIVRQEDESAARPYWTIRPARSSGTVPTAGMQRALDLVRDAALADPSAQHAG